MLHAFSCTNGKEEDDGIILAVVIEEKKSFLLALDAKTMQEIATADAPHLIPMGLHGQFFDKSSIS